MAAVSDTSTSSPARQASPFDLRSTQPSPLAPGAFGASGHSSESTIVTAAASAEGSFLRPGELAAEGRVARPARRRTRASRKAPVTLLNTDTTNFRAMVQQFTGYPAAAAVAQPPPQPQYASGYSLRPGFGLSIYSDPSPPPPPPVHFLQRPQYLEQQHQQMQYQFPEAAMFRFDRSDNNNNSHGGQNEAFLHNPAGLSSGNLETMAHAAGHHDAFLFRGQMPSSSSMMRRSSSDSASRVHDEYYSS